MSITSKTLELESSYSRRYLNSIKSLKTNLLVTTLDLYKALSSEAFKLEIKLLEAELAFRETPVGEELT
jgi:hypothetical protein